MAKKHFLVIRFSSIGDIVLTTGILGTLKKRFGNDTKISFLTFDHFKATVENNPLIDNLIALPKEKGIKGTWKIVQTIRELHAEDPIDLALDLHVNTRTLFLKVFIPSLFFLSFDKRKIERTIFSKFKVSLFSLFQNGREHVNDRIVRDFAPQLGWGDKSELTFVPRAEKKEKKIFFMPSAAHENKRWPLKYYEDLVQDFLGDLKYEDYELVILGGPKDDFLKPLEKIALDRPNRVTYAQGKWSLSEVISEMKSGVLFIGNDTGLTHISEALNVPVILFMGPTHQDFGYEPVLKESIYKYNQVACRPCHHFGAGKCTQSERFCLTKVSPTDVKKDADRMLGLGMNQ